VITTLGKTYIKRYLAGQVASIAQAISFGVGTSAEALGDTRLAFEYGRSDIFLTSYDFTNDKLVFKAELPSDLAGKIYEVGIWSNAVNTNETVYGSKSITTFDSETETWLTGGGAPVFTTTSTRIGIDSLNHTPSASTTATSNITGLVQDFSGYSSADIFAFSFNVGNANTSNVVVRFLTDASNYYTITLGAQTAGYKTVTATKGSATATGSPNWGSITEIQVLTTSGAGGASSVDYDGIRIEDVDYVNPEYVLVARELLASPFTKVPGQIQELEFQLAVSV